ncbi:sensory neuron membrane protein 1-like isoform X3 [Schistocerca serialis cubense]|uniref:sensory neuron membrane protein 1-like isoform X3 n=1 Tax=Schistocerca serialis cubense TaxID=2023355 RepID=UPI00214F3274|nr:sensory neuron membrane protein 1-like isoform X3 [Schistocerca serialis cubense]
MQLPVGLAAGGGGVFFMAVVAGWYGMPKLISSQIASGLALKKGSDIRQMWSNFSDPIDFRVYVLNLTNPEAVHRGEKPIVQEIGPYFYEEYKQKVKLRDHKEDDTVSYNNKITWLFNQGKSAPGLTGDEMVTMPHPLLLKNGTVDAGRLRVKRGIQNIDDLGRVVAFNGEPKMSSWRGDPCNDLRGTDSTIFPPFRDPKEPIVAFGADLCLSLGANWERKAEYMGVPGNRYTAELPDMKGNPEHHCYCPTEQTCLEKGTLDLSPCAGAPVIATLPHFYLASETYLQTVSGLRPTKENHELFMVFESTTGSPMEARKRLQFNMFLHKINKIDLLANVPYALMPLIWVEEGLALEEKYVSTLRMLFRMQGIMSGVKWTLMAVGMGMAGAGGYLHFKRRKELVVGPAEPKKVVAGHDTTGHPIRLESSHSRY